MKECSDPRCKVCFGSDKNICNFCKGSNMVNKNIAINFPTSLN